MSTEETVKILLKQLETLTKQNTELNRQLAAREQSADDLTTNDIEDAIYDSKTSRLQ